MEPFEDPLYVTRPKLPDLPELMQELKEIWQSQWLTNNGPKLLQLENELIKVLKTSGVSLFNNGTTALLAAVRALDLKNEVITTPFTFAATPHALSWNGVQPVFCDIDDNTLDIDPEKVEALINVRTSGILAVHVFGNPCAVDRLAQIAEKYRLKLIYDAAHAFNTEIGGTGIGNFGDITMFSFHATKLFHTGEGGALTCRNPEMKKRIDLLRNFGIEDEDHVNLIGFNGKMNEIQAALGLINLRHIQEERQRRQAIRDLYREGLREVPGIKINMQPENVQSSYQYFSIRIQADEFGLTRDEVYRRLRTYNVFARKYFFPLCSNYPCYHELPSAAIERLPVANQVASEVLCLPFYGKLENSQVERICQIIREIRTGKA
jgi:dTDP-4-amino-4,6-dideoxygalactose transaminase